MSMLVNLKCKKRNVDGSFDSFDQWNIDEIRFKRDISKQIDKLHRAHRYRENELNRDETILYVCSCRSNIDIEMSIVERGKNYFLSDLDAGQHDIQCPCFSRKQHHDGDGNVIALSEDMFMLPKNKQTNDHCSSTESDNTSLRNYPMKKMNTFNGLMYSLFDSANIALDRRGIYSRVDLGNQIIGRFINLSMGVDQKESFAEYKKRISGDTSVSFDVGFMDEERLLLNKMRWDKGSKKYIPVKNNSGDLEHYDITLDFLKNIEKKKYRLANGFHRVSNSKLKECTYPIIYNNVLEYTLRGIQNNDNLIKGHYFYLAIKRKEIKKEKYLTVVNFFLQPIYVSENYILPVESDFERACIEYLDTKNESIRMYKPMTQDKRLFFQNLKQFLQDKTECFDIYMEVQDQYSDKMVRPDLFMVKNDILYVFEFVGRPKDPEYCRGLLKKREGFYQYFSKYQQVVYAEIWVGNMIEDFISHGL